MLHDGLIRDKDLVLLQHRSSAEFFQVFVCLLSSDCQACSRFA